MARRYDKRRQAVRSVAEDESPETMSSWLQRQASSHNAQLLGTALLSGAAVAGAIFGIQALRRQIAVEDLKASIPGFDEREDANGVRPFHPDQQPLIHFAMRTLNSSSEAYGLWCRVQNTSSYYRRSA